MSLRIASIVEGHSEVASLPILLRRLFSEWDAELVVDLPTPIRIKRDRFILNEVEFGKYVELAALKAMQGGGRGHVLILLDADDDCPAQLGPKLLVRARTIRTDVGFTVVLAQREFEAWFIAAAQCFGGPLPPPRPDPESVRGAKEWVGRHLLARTYAETIDQPKLTARLDCNAALAAPSFAKLCRDLRGLLGEPSR